MKRRENNTDDRKRRGQPFLDGNILNKYPLTNNIKICRMAHRDSHKIGIYNGESY